MGGKTQTEKSSSASQLSDVYPSNMVQYTQPTEFMNDYYTHGTSFIGNKIKSLDQQRDSRSVNLPKEFIEVYQHANMGTSSHSENELNGLMSLTKKYQDAQVFRSSSLPDSAPEAFLFSPTVREDTDTSKFGNFPCGGGTKGPARYYQPGQKVGIRWKILNPVKDSKCMIKFAEKNDQNTNSYTTLNPFDRDYDDYTGYFGCGTGADSETAIVQIPSGSDCPSCTLQFIYSAPGYGESYQCADISTDKIKGSDDCDNECFNGGICFEGVCN